VSRAHDRFEALAGALALGEATDAERMQFAEHARTCARCAEDAAAFPATLALVGEARESERWQPSLGRELAERLRSRRETRSRRTFASLGFGIVASLALNVLFVSGVAGRAVDALRVAPDPAPLAGTRLTLEERRTPRARAAAPAAAPRRLAALPPPAPPRALAPVTRAPVAGSQRTERRVREAQPPAAPEVVAGLALAPGDVATLNPEERCAASAASLDAAPAPCPATPASALFR
jgi:hypothetical protein